MARHRCRLEARLRSCLQAILDLERDLQQVGWRKFMQGDLAYLRGMQTRIGSLPLQEQEVRRVERVTCSLLQELQAMYALRQEVC
ncbi:MAG: hypothetical protein ACOC43_02500 [Desulfohalobiaceae bacterium]